MARRHSRVKTECGYQVNGQNVKVNTGFYTSTEQTIRTIVFFLSSTRTHFDLPSFFIFKIKIFFFQSTLSIVQFHPPCSVPFVFFFVCVHI